MADTLTAFLSAVKQTIGGNRNTWGSILNANMDLIDAGVAGRHPVSTTGGTTTLLDTEWINRIIDVSGVLGSNAIIVMPNLSGWWLVNNATSGAFTLSFKTASGAAVVATQGGWNLLWGNGSDVLKIGPSSLLFSSQFQAPDGTVALPGISFASDIDTGIRRAGYSSGTLSSNPFTTVDTTPTVTVAHTAHGMATGDYSFFSGATAVGGITPDGLYSITRINDNSYTVTHGSNATSSVSGGGTPAYKYMIAAATAGNAIAIVANGADVAHVSPYGVILTGAVFSSGAARFGGAVIGGAAATFAGLLTAAGATLSALLTGTTATLSGLLTLSSTSHWLPSRGTTAQRPGSAAQASSRYNTTDDIPEWADAGGIWRRPSLAQPIAAGFKNLVIQNNSGTPNTQIDIDADAVTVETSGGVAYRLTGINITIDAATTGANGLDAGGLANNTWYYPYVIYNPATDTVAGLISTSATSPALPSGYTAKTQRGAFRTNGSAQFNRILQKGLRAQYVVSASVTTALPNIANGAAGTWSATAPTWAAASVSDFVPSTASRINIVATAKWNNGTASNTYVAPNNLYAGSASVNPPPFADGTAALGPTIGTGLVDFALESTNVYWVSDGNGGAISCLGWEEAP